MLRRLLTISALVVAGAVVSARAMASVISGPVALSGDTGYRNNNGVLGYFGEGSSAMPQFSAVGAPGGGSGTNLSLTHDFIYNGNVTPAISSLTSGRKSGNLTLDSITSQVSEGDGTRIGLSGVFNR